MDRKHLLCGTIIASALLLAGCTQREIPLEEPASEETLAPGEWPEGFEPMEISFAANTEMETELSLSRAVTGDEETDTRSLQMETDDKGKVRFVFNDGDPKHEGSTKNMMVIFHKKGSDQYIYLCDLPYKKGESDPTKFTIKVDGLKGWRSPGTPALVPMNDPDWYVMCIHDNPEVVRTSVKEGDGRYGFYDTGTMSLPVGGSYKDLDGVIRKTTIMMNGTESSIIDKTVEIPFVSGWVPVEVTRPNVFRSKERVQLRMQGVLLRFDVENTTPYPLSMEQIGWETNALHGNVVFSLRPSDLPEPGENGKLKWKPVPGDTEQVNPNAEPRPKMGASFVGTMSYHADKDLHATMYGKQHLKAHAYIWGMPRTKEEIDKIKSDGNILMTAVFARPDVAVNKVVDPSTGRTEYAITAGRYEDFFDRWLAAGSKPMPLIATRLTLAEGKRTFGTDEGKVVPVKIKLKARKSSPVERLAVFHSIKGPDGNPAFSTSNNSKITTDIIEEKKKAGTPGSCYFGVDDITPIQPDGSTDYSRYRLKMKDGRPMPGFHIPDQYDIRGILPWDNYQWGESWGHVLAVNPTVQGGWKEEAVRIDRSQYYVYSFYKQATQEEADIMSGMDQRPPSMREEITPFLFGLRGLRKVEGKPDNYFDYSPMMGIYLYSSGTNEFYIEYIPLTEEWVERFNHDRDKLLEYVMSPVFWQLFRPFLVPKDENGRPIVDPNTNPAALRETVIHRTIAHVNNYGPGLLKRLHPIETGALCWLSGLSPEEMRTHTYCFGFFRPKAPREYKKQSIIVSWLDNGYRNTGKTKNRCYYGVHLMRDSGTLWDKEGN